LRREAGSATVEGRCGWVDHTFVCLVVFVKSAGLFHAG
jgi:hypothetical protein